MRSFKIQGNEVRDAPSIGDTEMHRCMDALGVQSIVLSTGGEFHFIGGEFNLQFYLQEESSFVQHIMRRDQFTVLSTGGEFIHPIISLKTGGEFDRVIYDTVLI